MLISREVIIIQLWTKKGHCSYSQMKHLNIKGKAKEEHAYSPATPEGSHGNGFPPSPQRCCRDRESAPMPLWREEYEFESPSSSRDIIQLSLNKEILYSLQFPGLFPRHITTSTRREERLQSLSWNKSALFPEEILSYGKDTCAAEWCSKVLPLAQGDLGCSIKFCHFHASLQKDLLACIFS